MMKANVTLLAGLVAGVISGPALSFEQDKLVIWSGSTNRGVVAVAQQFTDELGIEVVVEHPEPVTDKFQQSAANGQGPDIILWAHDRFGEWGAGGLITPVAPSREVRERMFDFSWDALTLNGRTWGYPLTIEAVGLIYNKDLLPEPPSSFEQMFELRLADGVKTIMWDYNNAYFSMPLLMANGGYVFKQENGVYDARDLGVNNEGAVKGASMIKRLIDEQVMPVGADYNVMDTAFNKGELAMMINGPWAWDNLKTTGINFGVVPLPTIENQSPKSFIGVIAAGINAASPNQDLAVEFIENYLLTEAGLAELNQAVAIGAVAHKAYSEVLSQDPNVAATQQIAAEGVPMPGIPETGKFWAAMNPALQNITGGQQTVEQALDDAAARILAK
ncbi:maltose/maltodextrin ABC transporter substrate-binding protein MalE [Zobellella endophytica]|uniref:Maltodextrin-binding protein n=1 Tax=Zobellella endophytica TaxID=2116700 RepID=A0A2P7RBC2_9GAMM|nr:maltose/maltodextrin ABC transporter substrate-binding protein MalE [Zobellella endophytica]PSJ47538.1 maltose/maltodextrin ABC transporter substrate-binding protein MalE [Zobellella endophytica]